MDLQFLRDLYGLDGPVVSVHLDTSREDQDADRRVETEWRRLRAGFGRRRRRPAAKFTRMGQR